MRRIRFAGFGGQGVVLCGYIFGRAAMLDGRNSIHTQSYGSASRGGLTRSDVAISNEEIYDLIHDQVDVLVTMSQQSYDAFRGVLIPDGLLFYEAHLVRAVDEQDGRCFAVQAVDTAHKKFGRKIIANMLMLGFVNQVGDVVSYDSLAGTVRDTVPPGTEDTNIAALEEGMRLARQALDPESRKSLEGA